MKNLLFRELRFEAAELAPDAPIPCTVATNAPVTRYGVLEVLDCTSTGVDLARAPLPLIITHDSSDLAIGLVVNLQATGDRVTGQVIFGTSPEAQQIRADVVAGIHRSLSVGYALLDQGSPIEGGSIYRWQPYEVSIVPVPADPAAGFYRSFNGVPPMPAINTLNRDALEIVRLCRTHRVENMADGFLERGLTVADARGEILNELVARDQAAGGHLNLRTMHSGTSQERALIENTLVARLGGKPQGEVIRAIDCTGLASRALQMAGHRVEDREGRDRILQRALLTTSDFPVLLSNAIGRVLLESYEAAPAALKAVSRMANLPDFRAKSIVRLGGAPSLEKVNEHGEYKYGFVNEAVNTWRLATFGRIVGLTRQALVNDDLGGFADLLTKFGQSAAQREADELVSALVAAPVVDTTPLFHASRSSLITKALGLAGLAAAVVALRAQKDLSGGLIIQEPATLVVPSALEMTARQLVAAISPAQASNVQPFALTVVVEPRLDATSSTAWYLVADRQAAFEHGYLDGAQGVQIEQREGFSVDGLEIKARLDFGCGWVSPVGWVKSDGTVA